MMRRNSVQLRTYLLLNLVFLAVLLIVLWRADPSGAPWSDLTIRFPTLLLVLLVINTVLFFRDYLKPCVGGSESDGKSSLATVSREILAAHPDDAVLKRVLEKAVSECRASAGFFLAREEGEFPKLKVVSGVQHPSLSAGRFVFSGTDLTFRHPGSLGEEVTWNASAGTGLQSVVSRIGRFRLSTLPVYFSGKIIGWFVFQPHEDRSLKNRCLDELSVLMQGSGALWFQNQNHSAGSGVDSVAGLPRFEAFQEALEIELERSERYSQNLTLLQLAVVAQPGSMVSIDDQVLAAASQAVKDSLRRLDQAFVSHSPGHFSALLTETTPDVAKLVAERIHTAFLRRISQRDSGKSSGSALRMGSATYPGDASHADGLREKADDALQKAVSRGQNFVTFAGIEAGESLKPANDSTNP